MPYIDPNTLYWLMQQLQQKRPAVQQQPQEILHATPQESAQANYYPAPAIPTQQEEKQQGGSMNLNSMRSIIDALMGGGGGAGTFGSSAAIPSIGGTGTASFGGGAIPSIGGTGTASFSGAMPSIGGAAGGGGLTSLGGTGGAGSSLGLSVPQLAALMGVGLLGRRDWKAGNKFSRAGQVILPTMTLGLSSLAHEIKKLF